MTCSAGVSVGSRGRAETRRGREKVEVVFLFLYVNLTYECQACRIHS